MLYKLLEKHTYAFILVVTRAVHAGLLWHQPDAGGLIRFGKENTSFPLKILIRRGMPILESIDRHARRDGSGLQRRGESRTRYPSARKVHVLPCYKCKRNLKTIPVHMLSNTVASAWLAVTPSLQFVNKPHFPSEGIEVCWQTPITLNQLWDQRRLSPSPQKWFPWTKKTH